MSPEQHALILKCLGLDNRKSPDRNAVVSGDGKTTFADVQDLVKAGYLYAGARVPGGLTYYHATEAGIAVAKLTHADFLAIQAAILSDYTKAAGSPVNPMEFPMPEDDGEFTPASAALEYED